MIPEANLHFLKSTVIDRVLVFVRRRQEYHPRDLLHTVTATPGRSKSGREMHLSTIAVFLGAMAVLSGVSAKAVPRTGTRFQKVRNTKKYEIAYRCPSDAAKGDNVCDPGGAYGICPGPGEWAALVANDPEACAGVYVYDKEKEDIIFGKDD